jgi:hypothetical protein
LYNLKMSIMKKHTIFFILILFSLLFGGCKYDFVLPVEVPVIDNGGNPISFSTQVAPIFSTGNKCTECHKPGGTSPDFLTSATLYSMVTSKVNVSSPADSKLLTYPGSSAHTQRQLTATEAALILTWIKEGAKNN